MGVKGLVFRSCHNSSRLTGENGIIFKFPVEGDFSRFVSRVYNFYSKPVTKIGPGLKDPNVRMVSTIELDPLKKSMLSCSQIGNKCKWKFAGANKVFPRVCRIAHRIENSFPPRFCFQQGDIIWFRAPNNCPIVFGVQRSNIKSPTVQASKQQF